MLEVERKGWESNPHYPIIVSTASITIGVLTTFSLKERFQLATVKQFVFFGSNRGRRNTYHTFHSQRLRILQSPSKSRLKTYFTPLALVERLYLQLLSICALRYRLSDPKYLKVTAVHGGVLKVDSPNLITVRRERSKQLSSRLPLQPDHGQRESSAEPRLSEL